MKTLLFACLVGLAIVAKAEPRVDTNAVTLPTFIFDQRHAVTAGIAFLFEEGGQQFLATAYHVLGPSGGLRTKIAPRDVPREVKAIAALCLGDGQTVLLTGPALPVPDARSYDANGGEADVTLAPMKTVGGPRPLKLATALPKVGTRVWLFVRLVDRDRPTLYPARIVEAKPTYVQYTLEDEKLNLRAASGAPVVAEDGTVVAMHLGYGKTDEALVGISTPAGAIRERLSAALRPSGKP